MSEIYFARWRCEETSHFIKQAYHLEGFGKIFAEGVKKAAEILGGGASKYVIHVKGAGYNMHDWRTAWGAMLGQVTSGTGACWQGGFSNDVFPQFDMGYHERTPRFTTEGLAATAAKVQFKRAWDDCFGQCFLGGMDESDSEAAFLIPKTIAVQSASGQYGMSAVAAAIVGFADLTLGADVAPVLEAHNVLSLHNSLFLLYLGLLPWGKGNLFSQPI